MMIIGPCRKRFAVLIRKEFQKIFRPTRQFRCTARPSAPRNSSRLSMAVVSIFRCGSINRCGVLAGADQFGKADQGIFSFWIHSYLRRKPLKYIGFDGNGHQVRDCLHPKDLVPVLVRQMEGAPGPALCNFSGGVENSLSLRQLSDWCALRFGYREIGRDNRTRPFDVPWLVLDASQAQRQWNSQPQTSIQSLLEEIATHAEAKPDWLEISS